MAITKGMHAELGVHFRLLHNIYCNNSYVTALVEASRFVLKRASVPLASTP